MRTIEVTVPAPKWCRVLLGVLGVAIALSALGMMGVALFAGPKPYLNLFGFELVAFVGGITAVFLARGKAPEGFGLAVLGIAGAVGAGAVLAYMGSTGLKDFLRPAGKVEGVPLGPWLIARVLAAGAMVGIAAWSVLIRQPRSFGVLVRSAAALAPALGIVAGLYVFRKPLLFTAQAGALEVVRLTAILIVAVIVLALVSVGGHLAIRAFELGRVEKKV